MATIAQQMRIAGFKANLRVRGRSFVADTGEKLQALVDDTALMQDPDQPAQAQTPVYVNIVALAGCIASPRAIETLTENKGQAGEKSYSVLRYEETTGDVVTWKWFCEADRTNYGDDTDEGA